MLRASEVAFRAAYILFRETSMQSTVFDLGPLETNCYLIYTDTRAVAVDPGGEPSKVLDFLRGRGLTLEAILLTHLHFDHTYGVSALERATKAPVRGPEADRFMLETPLAQGGMWGLPEVEPFSFTSLAPGVFPLLGGSCTVLATPGHSPGGLSYYFPAMGGLFAGDTLFYRSVGRTDFPGGSFEELSASIREKIFTLPDETRVFPGHGPDTTVGDEKRNNPHVGDFR